jgi:MerR family glutamine synthetase transcriptional repressor
MVRTFKRVAKTRSTPIYNIGATSRLVGLPIWTLRWIEKHKLIAPGRTEGRQRLFSDDDLDHLNVIRELMDQKVNLAGIRVILKMRGAPGRRPS